MISESYLIEWRQYAPWPELRQVEQDLIICRALVDIFSNPFLSERLAFRGGTAINKLLFHPGLRYSEDIDLVQITAESIGPVLDELRTTLGWLGDAAYKRGAHSNRLVYEIVPEGDNAQPMKLKIEINTREHAQFAPCRSYSFSLNSSWYSKTTDIVSFEAEELFATKLRALLQRAKHRDLFDLKEGLDRLSLKVDMIISGMTHYLELQGHSLSRAKAEEIMLNKLTMTLVDDIAPLLPADFGEYTEAMARQAFWQIWDQIICLLPGAPWKNSAALIARWR